MQMATSPEQAENVWFSIRDKTESDWKITSERAQHPLKQYWPRTSTEAGIEIAKSDTQPENAWFSMRESFESDSNVTRESVKQLLKQPQQRA
jgi:hypothetical protein